MMKLQMNNLNGHVPNSFSNMNKLEVVYLGQNSFTGDMPSTVIQLPILCYTNLHGKHFDQFTVSNNSWSQEQWANRNHSCDANEIEFYWTRSQLSWWVYSFKHWKFGVQQFFSSFIQTKTYQVRYRPHLQACKCFLTTNSQDPCLEG